MNILWIYNMPLVPEAGGTERITSLVAEGLESLGHNALGMLVFKEDKTEITYNGKLVTNLYDFLHEHNVDVVINQIAYSKWLLRDFLARGGDRWYAAGGRVISCLHFDSQPQSTFYYFSSKLHKSVNDRRMIIQSWLLAPYYRHIQDRQYGEIYRYVYDHSDAFVTLSDTHHPYIKRVCGLDDYSKLTTIHNPLTFEDILNISLLDHKKKTMLVCARMDEYQKKLSKVLKAWRLIENSPVSVGWQLKMVGAGPDLDSYRIIARRLGLKRISFEGRQNPEPYYSEASIFMMTSGFEGWGLTLTESLQRGVVPVAMNTATVFSDIIQHCYNGYLTKPTIKDFASHILSLMSDSRRLRAMQQSALASAPQFSKDKIIAQWQNLLNHLIHT